jgi:hypothetical protein
MARYVAWTQDEENILREFYPTKGARFVAGKVGRSKESVITKAKKMGIKSLVRQETWRKNLILHLPT